jgi:hypothetical protein
MKLAAAASTMPALTVEALAAKALVEASLQLATPVVEVVPTTSPPHPDM